MKKELKYNDIKVEIINNEIIQDVHKNQYVLEYETMSGDADAYEQHQICFKKSKLDELKKYIFTLEELIELGDGQCYDYDSVTFEDIFENLNIPGDVTVDGQFRQTVTSWSVVFYDENGKMLEVKITGIDEGDDI